MKRIQSYQTSDGALFKDIEKAEKHQLKIFIRGIVQRSFNTPKYGQLTHSSVAEVIADNKDSLYDYFKKFNQRAAGRKANQHKGWMLAHYSRGGEMGRAWK